MFSMPRDHISNEKYAYRRIGKHSKSTSIAPLIKAEARMRDYGLQKYGT